MNRELLQATAVDHHMGCFGNFNSGDTICKRFCALSLRCAIEQDQKSRIEILEEMISGSSETALEQ